MLRVIVHKIAKYTLQDLSHKDKSSFNKLVQAIDDLSEFGIKASNVKPLKTSNKIFRKRVGRWRVLFTIDSEVVHIWITAIEKDTKKDYQRWIYYISNKI